MADLEARLNGAILNTGLTPNFMAYELGILSISADEYLVEIARRPDLYRNQRARDEAHGDFIERWANDWIASQKEFKDKQRARAMVAWIAVQEEKNTSGNPALDANLFEGFNALYREYLDESSIREFIDIATADKISSRASASAYARHAENRAMKAEARAWYQLNRETFSNLDNAAIAAMKIVPVAFRTVRDWIGEYERALRAARKA